MEGNQIQLFLMRCTVFELNAFCRPMADNPSSGLTFFEKMTLQSALMADNILYINMKKGAVGPVG